MKRFQVVQEQEKNMPFFCIHTLTQPQGKGRKEIQTYYFVIAEDREEAKMKIRQLREREQLPHGTIHAFPLGLEEVEKIHSTTFEWR